ncbi:MAG: homoserine kinase [Acidimicrobiaceae bacterium]|nr:homoserine kinase [Acidimicrobiaceae bacterium]
MIARVPASSANLGPGFDTLAVALNLYVEVSVEPARSFSITSEGFGAGRFDGPDHLAAVVARETLGHSNFKLHVNSEIPLSRGLGSSAALAVAAAAAAGAHDPLAIGTEVDGHAENAAASLLGGLVAASVHERDGIVARSLALDEAWRFVVVIPDQELATAEARRVLPASVPLRDAVHNLNAMGLLIAGMADHRDFVPWAMEDHLHQPYRMGLLPFAAELLDFLRAAGAAGSCWSGAGSTILALVLDEFATHVRDQALDYLEVHRIPGTALVLEADRVGLVTS